MSKNKKNSDKAKISLYSTNDFKDMKWSLDQKRAIEFVKTGKNVFITGPGGVGKTAMIAYMIAYLEESGKLVRVTASTGSAACAIGGITLHHFVGCKDGSDSIDMMKLTVDSDPILFEEYVKTEVLVIDEISMVTPEFLDKVDQLFRHTKGKPHLPFGGIQLILVGDFLQLPPVNKNQKKREAKEQTKEQIEPKSHKNISQLFFKKNSKRNLDDLILVRPEKKIDYNTLQFVFELPLWNQLNLQTVHMTTSFRQTDKEFVEFLNRMRMGELNQKDKEFLKSRVGYELKENPVDPIMLYPLRKDVHEMNDQYLESIDSPPVVYTANCHWTIYEASDQNNGHLLKRLKHIVYQWMNHGPSPSRLVLKLGVQVVLTQNRSFQKKLVNGTRGMVVGFSQENWPIVKFENGLVETIGIHQWKMEEPRRALITYTQIPLMVAKVITIHRCIQWNSLILTENGICRIRQLFEQAPPKKDYYAKDSENTYRPLIIPVCGQKGIVSSMECFKSEKMESCTFGTKMGFEICGSALHRVLCPSKDNESKNFNWVYLKDLKIGQCLQLRGNTQIYAPTPCAVQLGKKNVIIDGNMSFLIGRLWIMHQSPFECETLESLDYITSDKYCQYLNFITQQNTYQVKYNAFEFMICNTSGPLLDKTQWDFLYCFGKENGKSQNLKCLESSWEKRMLPQCILQNTMINQWIFIQGMFPTLCQTINFLLENSNHSHMEWIEYHFSSKFLVQEIQVLLLNMGILSKVVQNDSKTADNEFVFAIQLFIPSIIQFMEIHKLGPQWGISIHVLTKLVEKYKILKNKDCKIIYKILDQIYSNKGIFMDEVVFKTPAETQNLYDLHIPCDHTYLANGIVNHNSQGMTFQTGIVNLGSGIFGDGQAYVAISRFKDSNFTLVDLDLTKIRANPIAVQFYKSLPETKKDEIVVLD